MAQADQMEISARYNRFAKEEASGRSPLYVQFARGVAEDADVINFILALPREKQQPNLLFATVRHLFGRATDWPEFRRVLMTHLETVRSWMLTHSTQTNEPGRCASLLPVLALLPQPLALIEVGAAAGLCLLPDRYAYNYAGLQIHPEPRDEQTPLLDCAINDAVPVPAALPRIIWRAGLDLNPLDPTDPAAMSWLEALVWPEQQDRTQRLRQAIKIAAAVRPRVHKAGLTGDALDALCNAAPREATLVIFHTAVLAYVGDQRVRDAFARQAMSLSAFWIANESPSVFPDIASQAGPADEPNHYLVSVNGLPVAWTDLHGASLQWIAAKADPEAWISPATRPNRQA